MGVLAIIPARAGSKGIPNKNTRPLNGESPLSRAIYCASHVAAHVAVTSDCPTPWSGRSVHQNVMLLRRPPELAQDDTPMIAVVRHVLEQIPGPPDQPIVLLQPTQPLRRPEHVTQALALLTPDVDSVVSVVELPRTHNPEWQYTIRGDRLEHWPDTFGGLGVACRQDLAPTYIRDGTVYAFWRRTVTEHGSIYGSLKKALIIDPADTCPLDTEADWLEAERRLRAREG